MSITMQDLSNYNIGDEFGTVAPNNPSYRKHRIRRVADREIRGRVVTRWQYVINGKPGLEVSAESIIDDSESYGWVIA